MSLHQVHCRYPRWGGSIFHVKNAGNSLKGTTMLSLGGEGAVLYAIQLYSFVAHARWPDEQRCTNHGIWRTIILGGGGPQKSHCTQAAFSSVPNDDDLLSLRLLCSPHHAFVCFFMTLLMLGAHTHMWSIARHIPHPVTCTTRDRVAPGVW